jgi:hypothetical protein
MERYALMFTIKPGSEEEVARILSSYPRPSVDVDDDGTRLLSTSVFLHGNTVVRVMDIEGSLEKVMGHLARQPEIRAVEEQLNPHLEVERDMTSREGAKAFFERAMMRRVTHRVAAPADAG